MITCYSISERPKQKQKQNIVKRHSRRRAGETETERRINVGQPMESWTVLTLIEWNTMPSVFNFVLFSFQFLSLLVSDSPVSLAQSKFNCACYWCYWTSLIFGILAIIGFSLSCIYIIHCLNAHKKKYVSMHGLTCYKRKKERNGTRVGNCFKQKMNWQKVFRDPSEITFPVFG